ncbi:hypothetical protein SAMN05443637_109116 [Pseudonocardia thermophila]|jgi:hypothetical protein|uniref:Uncharacterized protein n=1 Tax=Pseudonocardia thermophila TaxID=1848 RepID=A0A1M6U3U8_PSETH|nr:PPA1309 family protein [Pseudonocardia thermophila]SHK63857.1 hypothetical protein SAMN05443637_109116 [Pseudonocardia thermophila]
MTDSSELAALVREVEQHAAEAGWDRPAQLFAVVPTAALLAAQPHLAAHLDARSAFTPIAQDALPSPDLAAALASIMWPDEVAGCAVVQEIMLAPPDADPDGEPTREAGYREARLVAAVLRDGPSACALRLRDPRSDAEEQLIEAADLAPNLVGALRETFAPA